jgi:queuine tRNA-ribosyltransferase
VKKFEFKLQKKKGAMRAGVMTTARGEVQTPVFMPVGTAATIKSLDTKDINDLQAQIILTNTYHLYLRPGIDILNQHGGAGKFMGWDKPMLTDSGGFQVFSLGRQRGANNSKVKLSDEGAEFTSHLDGSKHFFSPEDAIEIQRQIGADIIMTFDECVSDSEEKSYVKKSLEKTHSWAKRCYQFWEQNKRKSAYGEYQALFGIIQGAMYQDLREESAKFITSMDFDGIAVGGETIGYNMAGTKEVAGWLEKILPENKPRYAMGLGRDPENLVTAIKLGFDMFDCVGPTRLARNGSLFHGNLDLSDKNSADLGPNFVSDYPSGRLNISNRKFANDQKVIQEGCDCYTCTSGYTRSYLHHLYKAKELSYYRFASIHNVRFMIRLSQEMRSYILS